ncbi:hypothetical protein mRhiFer1_010010 [Rhinolophus ferrumequinum]|uniref:Uncharacterized protein n=1 Tax=Rhinolophus ferrumequinum TaxID=59479 RepID=A0A7J7Y5Y7_RHIFE|nr:hypothetical protein mRhiFer1_010010 [Rhinolophus ferrumequinum]
MAPAKKGGEKKKGGACDQRIHQQHSQEHPWSGFQEACALDIQRDPEICHEGDGNPRYDSESAICGTNVSDMTDSLKRLTMRQTRKRKHLESAYSTKSTKMSTDDAESAVCGTNASDMTDSLKRSTMRQTRKRKHLGSAYSTKSTKMSTDDSESAVCGTNVSDMTDSLKRSTMQQTRKRKHLGSAYSTKSTKMSTAKLHLQQDAVQHRQKPSAATQGQNASEAFASTSKYSFYTNSEDKLSGAEFGYTEEDEPQYEPCVMAPGWSQTAVSASEYVSFMSCPGEHSLAHEYGKRPVAMKTSNMDGVQQTLQSEENTAILVSATTTR